MKISVVIPMYNAEGTILKCLNSVVTQLPREKLEVLVVNDGSRDKSPTIVQNYIDEHDYDIQLIHQKNMGVSSARNVGIRQSKYDTIALIDSDDMWLQNKLIEQIGFMRKHNADFVGGLVNNIVLGFPYQLENGIYKITFNKLMIKMVPPTSTILFKKLLLDRAGWFDEKQKYGEDGHLWLRLSRFANMIVVNKTYAIYGDSKPLFGHSGLSGNLKNMHGGERKNLRDMLDLGYINKLQYIAYLSYISLKYYRRIVMVKSRRK